MVDEHLAPGHYEVIWDGRDHHGREVASGVYLYRFKTERFTDVRKALLLR